MTRGFVETLHFLELKILNYNHSFIQYFLLLRGAGEWSACATVPKWKLPKDNLQGLLLFLLPSAHGALTWVLRFVSKSFTC